MEAADTRLPQNNDKPPLPTDPVRSALMRRVRQRGTSAELLVASALRDHRLFYRLNVRSLPGSPDFANKRRHWAVMVNGCFWHHHKGCARATIPVRNRGFWLDKFTANRQRDAEKIRALRRLGFRVLVVWECQANDPSTLARMIRRFKFLGIERHRVGRCG